jgi:hypothetical protein
MKPAFFAGVLLLLSISTVEAKGWRKHRVAVGGNAGPALTGVPLWAAEAMRGADRPLPVRSSGRRPWAYALSHVNTPTTGLARYYGYTLTNRYPGFPIR